MADKAWKRREREVATYFNGIRTALSGINSKITRADVIHDELFVECKLRAKHSVVSLWDDTAKLAKDEDKIPVIALCEKNRPGFFLHQDIDLWYVKKTFRAPGSSSGPFWGLPGWSGRPWYKNPLKIHLITLWRS